MILHFLKHGRWSHDLINGRDSAGRLTESCTFCGYARIVLSEELVKGPAFTQVPDKGSVMTKAEKVTPFQRQKAG